MPLVAGLKAVCGTTKMENSMKDSSLNQDLAELIERNFNALFLFVNCHIGNSTITGNIIKMAYDNMVKANVEAGTEEELYELLLEELNEIIQVYQERIISN